MTTIVPDAANEEGKKLSAYQPGDTVEIEFQVTENNNGQLGVEVTRCDLVGGAEDEEYGEAPATPQAGPPAPPPKKGVPNAVVIAVGRGGK